MILSARRSERIEARHLDDAVLDAGVAGLPRAYADGQLDPVTVTKGYLARIGKYDGRIGAFVDLDRDRASAAAFASAARWSAGRALSPLDGVPVAIKSNIAVAGLPWTAGIGAYRDRRAHTDAACVRRLRAAGAIILGTVNMDEAALGATTDNPWFGPTRNPYRLDCVAGGSSGGSAAAVAAGLCAAALGTDSLGSVRIPASYCGVFGHKPGAGAIPASGIVPLAADFDVVGFLARSAADCRILADFFDLPADRPTPLAKAVVGISGFGDERASVGRRLRRRLTLEGIDFRMLDLVPDPFDQFIKPALLLVQAQAARTHRTILAEPSADLSRRLRTLFEWGGARPRSAVAQARRAIAAGKAMLLRQLAPFDLLITPATPGVAPRRALADDRLAARFTLSASLGGLPALVFPFGCNREGLPYSVQVIGQCDHLLLDLAARLAITPPRPRLRA